MNTITPQAAYIHIPFCRRRCYYCDFPISVIGDHLRGDTSGTICTYVEAVCREIQATPSGGKPLTTVFFGGGTPSLLSVNQLAQILTALETQFGLDANAEISMEMDPGTFDQAQIDGYRAWGVNRVSLGVQAFQSDLLQACGRTHRAEDVQIAFDRLHQAQVPNISLDLISGLPQQTLEQWQASLDCAIAHQPQHISVYDLTVEAGTAFDRWYTAGQHPLPTDEITTTMYRWAQQTLTAAGYEHYEISNYAQPQYQCRHNRVYWKNQPYYGFGMGATSYIQGQRISRPRKTREYYDWLAAYCAAGGHLESPDCPTDEMLLDTLMVGLRLAEGIALENLTQQFGTVILARLDRCLKPYVQRGWVQYGGVVNPANSKVGGSPPNGSLIRLTDPEGFLFSNVVLVALFEEFSSERA